MSSKTASHCSEAACSAISLSNSRNDVSSPPPPPDSKITSDGDERNSPLFHYVVFLKKTIAIINITTHQSEEKKEGAGEYARGKAKDLHCSI
mmetsp:Transcript_40649/g.65348  ORF Transcript_40649/g.65348 Transcript_40649/m.65348 type:complete len:92 (+) Transcript_40649:584-859(+)